MIVFACLHPLEVISIFSIARSLHERANGLLAISSGCGTTGLVVTIFIFHCVSHPVAHSGACGSASVGNDKEKVRGGRPVPESLELGESFSGFLFRRGSSTSLWTGRPARRRKVRLTVRSSLLL